MIRSLLARKPIEALLAEGENPNGLRRVLGPGDLIMLAIGAVIGAGIFSSIGTAAAGEILPSGVVVRYGAGPALVVSFVVNDTPQDVALWGALCLVPSSRIGVRARRALLRRAGVDDSPGGKCVRLLLCDAR